MSATNSPRNTVDEKTSNDFYEEKSSNMTEHVFPSNDMWSRFLPRLT